MKKMVWAALLVAGLGNLAWADGNKSKSTETKNPVAMTVEQRQKMAGLHEKMAVCLRSARPVTECHDEIMKGCKDVMGKETCPMMGGMMGHGKHHRHDHESHDSDD